MLGSVLARISAMWIVFMPAYLPVHRAAQVHQATIVERRAVLGVGGEHILQLRGQHCRRNFAILHGKRPAESAATVQVRQRNQFQSAHLAQQAKRPVAECSAAQSVATRVISHACGKYAPTSSTPSSSTRNSLSS